MFGSNPFGQSSSSPFGSQPAFGQTSNASNNPFAPKPFGSTSPFGSQTGSSSFGGMSTGLFGSQSSSPLGSTSVFGASPSPAFGSSIPAFGVSSASAFGGSGVFGQKPSFGGFGSNTTQTSPFGSLFQQTQPAFGTNLFGSSTPFNAPSQPAFSSSSSPAFNAPSQPAFGSSSSPAFGASSTPGFGATSTPAFGSTASPTFGSTSGGFGVSTSPFGSNTQDKGGPAPAGQSTTSLGYGTSSFGSASAPAFAQSSVGPFSFTTPSNPFAPKTTGIFGGSGFGSSPSSTFGSSPFVTSNASNPFGSTTSATSSLFGSTAQTFGVGTIFGNSSTSAPGSPSIFGPTSSQGTSSAFNTGLGFANTQSSPLFQSNMSTLTPASSPFAQTSSAFCQTAPGTNLFSTPSTGFGGNMFSSAPSLLSNSNPLGFGQTTPSLSSPFQLAQPPQSSGGFSFSNFGQPQAAGTSGFGGTPGIFSQSAFGQPVLEMAVVESPLPTSRLRRSEIDITRMNLESGGRMSGRGGGNEITEEVETIAPPPAVVEEEVMFVALGKDVKEGGTVLTYAVDNCKGMKICILHVHQPAQKIPMMGTTMPIRLLEEEQVKAYHEEERQQVQKTLDKFIRACERAGARAEKLCVDMESIENGIVQLIYDHGIKWLVMGAAANKSYSSKMKGPKSKKAIHVSREAPPFCHIWFVCKGNLINTRSVNLGKQLSSLSSVSGGVSPRSIPEGTIDWDSLSRSSPPVESHFSTSSSERNEDSPLVSFPKMEGSVIDSELPMFEQTNRDHRHSSAATNSTAKTSTSPPLKEENMNDELHSKLEQFLAEAESSQREVSEESIRRKKAEKNAIDAIRRAKLSEAMYTEELRRRREIEENLARGRLEIEIIKRQLDEVSEELRSAREQQYSLELQIADSDKMVEEVEGKMFAAVGLLQKYKTERDNLQVELDHAPRVAEELRKSQSEETSSSSVSQFFSEFSFSEIEEATDYFNRAMKIGEGGYGCIYKGKLRHTQVAIKIPHPDSPQGPLEFQKEVNILSKLRHPNIVTLIGACPETWALIYEYLPNGSLEDRLNCKNNTPPMTWQTRIRIAAELCSALIFLHSCRPRGVIHGDLKPTNILLDANFVSKVGDFGICRILPRDEFSGKNTLFCRTDPKGTFVYMDPEFLATGEITSKSDVYSFGIILLRLLTGKPASGIVKEVQDALDKENLKDLLDSTAGDWPFVQAKQLAHLAISCADMNRKGRPDLYTEVWRVLEPMRVSSGVSSFRVGSEEYSQIPSYFVCPIFQEIMQDPVVAADGFTYEAEALKGWLESGHDTSPMTNLKLPHNNVVPNHALRSAIQEWLHQH